MNEGYFELIIIDVVRFLFKNNLIDSLLSYAKII